METAERIVESYLRYVKRCGTFPNIKCRRRGKEIDVLAVSFDRSQRYHVAVSGEVDPSFKSLSVAALRSRFVDKIFNDDAIAETLREYDFTDSNHTKVVVYWSWGEETQAEAEQQGIHLWSLPFILTELAVYARGVTAAVPDDLIRMLQMLTRAGMLTTKDIVTE